MTPRDAYFADVPALHSWDGGQSWNTGGFGAPALRRVLETIEANYGAGARILETGAGNSTCTFLLAAPSLVVSIEPSAGLFDRVRAACTRFAIDPAPLRALTDRSERALPRIVTEPGAAGSFDVVLIDGNHGWPYVFVDLCYAHMLLRQGGLLLLDDVQIHAVKEAARFVARDPNYEATLDLNKTLGFRKNTTRRDFGYHLSNPYVVERTEADAAAGRAFTLFG
jgi:predicted O-methyltransferase YrrM